MFIMIHIMMKYDDLSTPYYWSYALGSGCSPLRENHNEMGLFNHNILHPHPPHPHPPSQPTHPTTHTPPHPPPWRPCSTTSTTRPHLHPHYTHTTCSRTHTHTHAHTHTHTKLLSSFQKIYFLFCVISQKSAGTWWVMKYDLSNIGNLVEVKTILRPAYLHNVISYIGQTVSYI